MAKVIARINKQNGEIEYEVEGVVGAKCKDITSILSTGLTILKEKEKDELFLTDDLPDYLENM